MIEIEKPKVDIVELGEDYRYGKFVIEPLERGYGITYYDTGASREETLKKIFDDIQNGKI